MAISDNQIKVLTLLTLIGASCPLPVSVLVETPIDIAINNPDITTDSRVRNLIFELRDAEQIEIYDYDGVEYAKITQSGKMTGETLRGDVPATLREKAAYRAAKEVAKLRRALSVSATVTENGDSGYTLTVTLQDSGDILLKTELYCPTKYQAELMARNFRTKPDECYLSIINALTADNKL